MTVVFAVLAGLVWGALCALLGGLILRRALEKNDPNALLGANLGRTLLDICALGLVFLLRKLLPFDYSYTLIATAAALSLGTIAVSFRLAGKK